MRSRKQIDLMAPAGSYESLMAAISAGANSVYFGIEQLNMRSRSSANFTTEDLQKIVAICRENGVRTYLTVNTVIYDSDLGMMKKVIDSAYENGVTAIIASDIAAIEYARSIGQEVHISTQQNVSNIEAVRFFSRYADVVVLARELTLEQTGEITRLIREENIRGPKGEPVEIEIFAHGALCMAVSGKCYMSLHQYNYSANRGACLQSCRRKYIVTDKETGDELEIDNEYIMSPKDLCTIGFIDKIIDAGVSVLKIEGRGRSPEYVKVVVECYNEAINAALEGSYRPEAVAGWKERLATVFNRGFWDGYYLGARLGEWSGNYGSKATKRKIFVASVMNYFNRIKVADFQMMCHDLNVGDEIMIIGPTTGVVESKVEEIRLDDESIGKAVQGDRISIPLAGKVRTNDKVYKVVERDACPDQK